MTQYDQQYSDILNQIGNAVGTSSGQYLNSPIPTSGIYLGPMNTPGSTQFTKQGPYATGPRVSAGTSQEDIRSYGDARIIPRDWTSAQTNQFVTNGILRKMSGFHVGMGLPDILDQWDELLKTSFELNQNIPAGSKKWTPFDVMNSYADNSQNGLIKSGEWMIDPTTGERVKYVGPKSKTQTSTSVNLSSAEDVKALTNQVLTQALGRAPTADEVAQYKSTINAQEQANPSSTTQTQTLNDMGEVTNTSSTTTGGLSAAAEQQSVLDKAKESPEYGKYQSATTYWGALMQAIGGNG